MVVIVVVVVKNCSPFLHSLLTKGKFTLTPKSPVALDSPQCFSRFAAPEVSFVGFAAPEVSFAVSKKQPEQQ